MRIIGVVRAKIQTVEDIYQLLRTAVVHKDPIRGGDRWLCPHGLRRNHKGNFERYATSTLDRATVGCKRSAHQPTGGVSRWKKLSRVELLERAWQTAPNHSRPQTCVAEVDVDTED